jgi:hypothetical protein
LLLRLIRIAGLSIRRVFNDRFGVHGRARVCGRLFRPIAFALHRQWIRLLR